jgi:hypothetical protein
MLAPTKYVRPKTIIAAKPAAVPAADATPRACSFLTGFPLAGVTPPGEKQGRELFFLGRKTGTGAIFSPKERGRSRSCFSSQSSSRKNRRGTGVFTKPADGVLVELEL